jgi:hypothetical protein
MFENHRDGPHEENAGTLDATGVRVLDVRGMWCPLTVSLASAADVRRIELSNDGATWFDGVLDLIADDQIAIVLQAPLRSVRLTGEPGDTWGIS